MNIITSAHNPVVKEVKLLKAKKHRDEKKLFFIEGIRFVHEALKEKAEIIRVLISEDLARGKGGEEILELFACSNYETHMVSSRVFKEVSDTDNPQGILAVIKAKSYTLDEILEKGSFFVILDSVQDPGNLGTIVRTADAAGADGLILSKGCVDLYNPKVLRSTMGSIFHIPAYLNCDILETIDILKARSIKVYAAHLKGKESYFDIDMKDNVAVIIGNEANGISNEAASRADVLVKIPMPGRAESLNASVAAGLLMYEVVRQRLGAG